MFFPIVSLSSQTLSKEKILYFPDILVEPMEILPSDVIPRGTFVRTTKDFILCRGRRFKGKPPAGFFIRIYWNKKVYRNAGKWNNMIVREIEKKGTKRKLLKILLKKLKAGINADPSFFPFLYNAGRIALLLRLPEKAVGFFLRAQNVLPSFGGNNLNLGFAYERTGEDIAALKNFRLAFKKNPFDYAPLIAMGNYYLKRKSFVQAKYYFQKTLSFDENNSAAKIGLARLYMTGGKNIKALLILKSIITENLDGTPRNDYDKSLHYYLALLSARLRDYENAYKNYKKLLEYPDDPFFLNVSILNIKRRMMIMKKLAEVSQNRLEK